MPPHLLSMFFKTPEPICTIFGTLHCRFSCKESLVDYSNIPASEYWGPIFRMNPSPCCTVRCLHFVSHSNCMKTSIRHNAVTVRSTFSRYCGVTSRSSRWHCTGIWRRQYRGAPGSVTRALAVCRELGVSLTYNVYIVYNTVQRRTDGRDLHFVQGTDRPLTDVRRMWGAGVRGSPQISPPEICNIRV